MIGRPVGLLARDYDGDERTDLVVATRSPAAVRVLRGAPGGPAREGPRAVLGDDYPLGPVAFGRGRFAVALQGAREVALFADGEPGLAHTRVELPATPRAIGSGDLRGDGSVELLLATDDNRLAVVGSDGSVVVCELPDEIGGRPTFVHVLGDGSGFVVGAQLARAVLAFSAAEVADGAALAPVLRVELAGIPRDAVEADLDRDAAGDPELVVVGGDAGIWVFGLGRPGGASAWLAEEGRTPRAIRAPGVVPVDVEAIDLDRDANTELVVLGFYDSAYGVLGGFRDGAPAFTLQEYAGQDPVDTALADLDDDGLLDLAVANRGAHRVSVLTGTGYAKPGRVSFHQALRVPVGPNPTHVATGNLDDDPLPDAVTLNAGDATLTARPNRPGLLGARGARAAAGDNPRALAVGDATGDGRNDVAVLEVAGEGARIALWDGRAGAVTWTHALDEPAADVAVGKGEILVAAGTSVSVLSPDAEPVSIELPVEPRALVAFQADDDDVLEIAAASDAAGRAAGVCVVDRGGGEPTVTTIPVPFEKLRGKRARDVAAADFDGDGEQDLAVLALGSTDTAPGDVYVFLRGEDGFASALALETGLAPAAIDAGDVNGDGRADLVCAAQNSHNVNVWLSEAGSDGELVMRRLADLGAGLGPLDVALVDLDGNGKLDLVTANNFSHDVSAIYNMTR